MHNDPSSSQTLVIDMMNSADSRLTSKPGNMNNSV